MRNGSWDSRTNRCLRSNDFTVAPARPPRRLRTWPRSPRSEASPIAPCEDARRVDPDADHLLLTISGDLGNAGRPADGLRLVVPHYDSRRHDPLIGTNLLKAAVAIHDLEVAERVLASLERLQRWDL